MTVISLNRPDAEKIEKEASRVLDFDEALMRAEYILQLRKVLEGIKELRDDEYLYSPNLPQKNVQQVHDHLSGAIGSIAKAVSWVTPAS